jgi:phospholipid/cholesterol/gamma-HCH transport system permease protein
VSPALDALAYLRELIALFLRALEVVLRGRVSFGEAARQAYELGNRSLVFVTGTMGFIGMVMVLQGCYQAQRLLGDYTMVGPGFIQLLV